VAEGSDIDNSASNSGAFMTIAKWRTPFFMLLAAVSAQGAGQQFVYPAAGQSSEQQALDQRQCSEWATEQTGYAPAGPTQGDSSDTGGAMARGAARGALAGWAIGAVAGGDRSNAVVASSALGAAGAGIRSSRSNQQQQAAQAQAAERHARARAACLEARGYTIK
jgi:hypothetical protein